ncbi:trichohyalin-like isoform X2 [Linepithema humile]|uniref:trichohyalin-like isoform X2 n=1 Tax=Linepithema humile TaxID=83485 RepID=UPI00351E8A60
MAEEEENVISLLEKDGTDTFQSKSPVKESCASEEPTPDVSISLLDIQIPGTPESTKDQISDGDTPRLESPKTVKPVLGKVQAKKRLMAFANQFKTPPKSQVKSNLSQHSTGVLKAKDKIAQDDTSTIKSRKKTEEKILAIEEIRREESKSKMLLAEAMAAANTEDENYIGKNTSGLLENTRRRKERNKHEGTNDSRKIRASMHRKYSERQRHADKTGRDSINQEVKDRNASTEQFPQKSSQDREKHKKYNKKKDDINRRDNSKTDVNRDKKEEGKDKKENEKEKREETRERKEESKRKKENVKDRRNDMLEMEPDKDKKDKDKDRLKEKELLKYNSWPELRKSGLTFDEVIRLKRRDNSERTLKNRTAQDYTRCFEQMLMLNNYRFKRQALIAEGLLGPKKYPPESIKMTKRAKGPQLLYCENPSTSLLLHVSQLLQVVTPERREKIRDICEAPSPRIDREDAEDTVLQKRNWYQQIISTNHKDTKWQVPVQLPRSRWDSEDEETSSILMKEDIKKPINKLHVSLNQQERCSTSSSITEEDKLDNKTEDIKEDNESSVKTIDNTTTNDEASKSPLLQPAGNEKLASEYEQFMKMVCTDDMPLPVVTDVAKECSPKKNLIKSASPRSYHEFNIESNLSEDNTNIEIQLKKLEKKDKLQTREGSIKSTECEESILSTDSQIQIDANNMQVEYSNNGESEDSKSVPSDWENVRIKVERLSDENIESREVKKKKKRKKVVSSSDSSSSASSSDSEKEKKRKKRKRKALSDSSSSDSDSSDSSSSSSTSDSSSDERRKRKRKKKKVGKKRKKAKRTKARMKKKRRRKMSTDSSSSDSDEHTKKKKRLKKKAKEAKQFDVKSINNGDISKIISKSPIIASSLDEASLQSMSPKKIKEEIAVEDAKRKSIGVRDNECVKRKEDRKESKSDKSFMEQWEVDSTSAAQQNDGDRSSQDNSEELGKMDGSQKDKYRRKRKHSRDNVEQDEDKSKVDEEGGHGGKERSDEELETKRKKRREKDIKSATEFLTDWERESERITQQMMQNEAKLSKKLGKQKKEKWGETDFDSLNVPSLTQLEKEVCRKQILADEWEVDSLEAIPDLTPSKRKNNQGASKKVEKQVRYDKKTDTYIAIEKESAREIKKRQERLCAIRIWEEEQEEGEKEEMMLLEQKSKHKRDDWDIEEEPFLRKSNEEIEICKVDDIVGIEEDASVKENSSKLMMALESTGSKRVRKSRWDMGSQSEEKLENKDIWEEEYTEWSKIDKCEPKLEKTEKGESRTADYSESSAKSNLIDFYHRKSQSRESLDRSWTSEEMASRSTQAKKVEDASGKNLISVKTNEEQITLTKEHQARDKFKEILGLDTKFKEKTVELYSPSSPALSQKSQDIEASNDSSSSNSLLHEKRKKEISITTKELPTESIPLQLTTKLRDTKHAANEKIEDIIEKVQLEDKDSVHKFDIKKADLFDDLPMNEPCLDPHGSKSVHLDIFAAMESEKLLLKQRPTSSNVPLTEHTKDDENEGKMTLKLIPKQLLMRRASEQVKPKRILEAPLQDPAQHAAALLTIQKKLLESHALKNDIKELPIEKPINEFKSKYSAGRSDTDKLLDLTEFAVAPKSSIMTTRQSRSPASEKAVSVRSEYSENYDKESTSDGTKKYKTGRNLNDTNMTPDVRSPVREQRKRSPSKKESEKRYSHDYNKDKKERKFNDEKSDRRDSRSSKSDFTDSRRRLSPSGRGRRRRSRSPYTSWERQGSGSPGQSWSRSHSRSPKRKDEGTIGMRDREKKRDRYDDDRPSRSRADERRERFTRSPPRYNDDNFKKHGPASSKGNRDDWNRRRHDSMDRDREKDVRPYDPMEMLRERTTESEKYRDNRFHPEEADNAFWQYENSNILRDNNESMDSYVVGQDLPLEYDNRPYYGEGSLERDMIQCSPQLMSRYGRSQNRSVVRRERQWEKDRDSSDLDRHGHLTHRSRNRTPPRSRHSPTRQALERFRRKSRSRSRSWSQSRSRTRSRSRSGSRSRSASRSRPRMMRSRSRSRSRSPSDPRSRARSTSRSRLRSPEHGLRLSELRSSRSPSPGRSRLNEIGRERKDEDENRKLSVCGERGRRIETIVQTGVTSGSSILDSEMGINNMDTAVASFQYSNEIEGGNEYYYTENNLTYPPCIDESTSSPKRLSLDDRLELELGIKKQHSKDSEYSSNFNPNVIAYPSPPPQQQQQMMYRQQPTVLQVGNVLQVVPADFNGVQSTRREVPAATTPPVRPGSNQVVRVGNVLQVVPTSLDWSQSSSSADQSSGVLYSSSTVSAPSPSTSSVPISVPVPVPVPLPVPPAVPAATNTIAPVATMSPATPLPLSLPVPVPVPVPIPSATATAFARNEVQPPKVIQPVYNYEAILETRRKEREERKRLRELRRKEKERKKIERTNRRALRLLEKNSMLARQTGEASLDHHKGSVVDPAVLKALREGEEQSEIGSPSANLVKEEEEAAASVKEEDEDAVVDEDEDDDEEEAEAEAEAEVEDDEEEEEEAEDEDEDDDDEDEKPPQIISQQIEIDDATTADADASTSQGEIEMKKEWPELPPPPLKGILVAPGFRDEIPNGDLLDDLLDIDDNTKDDTDKEEDTDKNNECEKDAGSDVKPDKSKLSKLRKARRSKKSVQFADGVRPGEGTSPSGGEGDMPSPPPPTGISLREGLKDLRRDKIYSSRKNRKQEKRVRPPKTKKKVKVKIIKLKKPRVTPLTAMMMDDSDELDDRSPPPPPPGSPPPPHLWPSYLSAYNTTIRTVESAPQTATSTLTPVQAPPPPTPLPLLIPPPPLNYTIQPCSKA